MSDNKPEIYGFCKAGCRWKSVHYDDFKKSATWIRQYIDESGVCELSPVNNYKIVSPVASNSYSCAVSLAYTDSTAKTHDFTISEFDEYRDYFYFEILSLTATETALTIVYEINGNRYSETVSGTAIDISAAKLKITGATEVLLFNADAEITGEKGEDGTLIYVGGSEVESVSFTSDPQTQINTINTTLGDISTAIDTINGEVV